MFGVFLCRVFSSYLPGRVKTRKAPSSHLLGEEEMEAPSRLRKAIPVWHFGPAPTYRRLVWIHWLVWLPFGSSSDILTLPGWLWSEPVWPGLKVCAICGPVEHCLHSFSRQCSQCQFSAVHPFCISPVPVCSPCFLCLSRRRRRVVSFTIALICDGS